MEREGGRKKERKKDHLTLQKDPRRASLAEISSLLDRLRLIFNGLFVYGLVVDGLFVESSKNENISIVSSKKLISCFVVLLFVDVIN